MNPPAGIISTKDKSRYLSGFKSIGLLCSLVLASCSTNQPSNIPGLDAASTGAEDISEIDVLASLKCQITKGLIRVDKLKASEDYSSNPEVEKFSFKSGSGTFSGQVKTVKTGEGTINVILPFSGYDGTIATPAYARTTNSTATHTVTRTFDVNTSDSSIDIGLCDYLQEKQVDVGSFISDAMVSSFTGIMGLPRKDGKPYGPAFTNSQVEINSTFSVVKKNNGGFSLKLIPSAPRINDGNTGIVSTLERTDIYAITLKLSTKVAETSDTRRLHFCVNNQKDQNLCVEEPYTDDLFDKFVRVIAANDPELRDSIMRDLSRIKADEGGRSMFIMGVENLSPEQQTLLRQQAKELLRYQLEKSIIFPSQQTGPSF